MKNLFITLSLLILGAPAIVFGQQAYRPLVNLPGLETPNFEAYINILYTISISLAALLAVVKIVIAGAKYMLSDIVTNKGEAIEDIKGALLGLLLILGAVVILSFINPNLTATTVKFDALRPQTPSDSATPGIQQVTGAPGGAPVGVPGTADLIAPLNITPLGSSPTPTQVADARTQINTFRTDCITAGGTMYIGSNRNIRLCKTAQPAPTATAPNPTQPVVWPINTVSPQVNQPSTVPPLLNR